MYLCTLSYLDAFSFGYPPTHEDQLIPNRGLTGFFVL